MLSEVLPRLPTYLVRDRLPVDATDGRHLSDMCHDHVIIVTKLDDLSNRLELPLRHAIAD